MRIQIVDINQDIVTCAKCGANLVDCGNFIYEEKIVNSATDRREYCLCRHCFSPFILLYNIFDPEGHVYPSFFCEDPNDLSCNWQNLLAEEQKMAVSKHMETCQICTDRLVEGQLSDAWFRANKGFLLGLLFKIF
jgi:hypothetical protein